MWKLIVGPSHGSMPAQIVQEALREKQAASAWRCAAEKSLQDRAELLAAAGRELAALQARVGPLSRELSKWKVSPLPDACIKYTPRRDPLC